jgi:6-phosphofructokinase 1
LFCYFGIYVVVSGILQDALLRALVRKDTVDLPILSRMDCATKEFSGDGGAVLEDVPHLTDWLPNLPTYKNPLKHHPAYAAVRQYFVADTDVVAKDVIVNVNTPGHGIHFRRAGPREKVYFKSEDVRACIVTCGGLCPGINTVIREIVCGLWTQYGVHEIFGIDGGYKGFYSRNTISLNPKVVSNIHKRGGTVLKTSRGGHDTHKIVDAIEDREFDQVWQTLNIFF